MQNPIQKFRQSSIVFEKPGILSENLKTLTSSNYPTIQYFLLKLRTRFLVTNVYKSYLQKQKKSWFLHTRFLDFINNSRSKQNKRNPDHPFLNIIK